MPRARHASAVALVSLATAVAVGGTAAHAVVSTTPQITVKAGTADFSVAVTGYAAGDVSKITWSQSGVIKTVLDRVDQYAFWSGRIGGWDWITVDLQRGGATIATTRVGDAPTAPTPGPTSSPAPTATPAPAPTQTTSTRQIDFVTARDQFSVTVKDAVTGDSGVLTWSVGGVQKTRSLTLSRYAIWSGVVGPWEWASMSVRRDGREIASKRVAGPAAPMLAPAPEATPTGTPTPTRPDISTLPKQPWDGGPAYWAKFPKAKAAGWTDPSFFPVAAWYDFATSPQEALSQLQHDKAVGINTWTGSNRTSEYPTASQFEQAGVFFVGAPMNATFDASATNYVGTILEDEVDMWYLQNRGKLGDQQALDAAVAMLSAGRDAAHAAGLFRYANYGFTIAGNDMPTKESANRLVNGAGVDVNSITSYPYSNEFCARPFDITFEAPLPPRENCISATSYGRLMASLDSRDRTDGVDVPTWGFVEAYDGGLGGADGITPDQLRGAVMSHLIHGARGINYFLHDRESVKNGGPLVTNVLRQAQWGNPKYRPHVEAMRSVNAQIQALAPVLNTQTTRWDAGTDVDSMLKVHGGHAYLFVMAKDGGTGTRRIQLPAGLADRAEVLGEGRTVSLIDDHFEDSFPTNASYHVYKIALAAS